MKSFSSYIRDAEKMVSALYCDGNSSTSWKYNVYDENYSAWTSSHGETYQNAKTSRAWTIAETAAIYFAVDHGATSEKIRDIEYGAHTLPQYGLTPVQRLKSILQDSGFIR